MLMFQFYYLQANTLHIIMSNLTLILLLTLPNYLSLDKHFINDLRLTLTLARIPSLFIYIFIQTKFQ